MAISNCINVWPKFISVDSDYVHECRLDTSHGSSTNTLCVMYEERAHPFSILRTDFSQEIILAENQGYSLRIRD